MRFSVRAILAFREDIDRLIATLPSTPRGKIDLKFTCEARPGLAAIDLSCHSEGRPIRKQLAACR